MKKTEYTSPLLRERYVHMTKKGLPDVYVFPKKMTTVYALFATKFGSLDTFFMDGAAIPDGIAHFLEHKLFENADGSDSFSHFSALGADANAYTTYNRTAYLFSATERIEEALFELLTFVTHPYFTNESVKKERGIIAEEIRMYEDSPWECVYQNLLSALYPSHPVHSNICGTVSSIQKITPELLYFAHNRYYAPDNMALVVCGDVDPSMVEATVKKVFSDAKKQTEPTPKRSIPKDIDPPQKTYVDAHMQVSKPLFHIGIKDSEIPATPEGRLRRDFLMTMLNELLFSQSAPFYHELLEKGLINPGFSHGYSAAEGFGFDCISGESDDPRAVFEYLWTYLDTVKREGLSPDAVERVRRVLYSDEIRAYDSTEEIANRLLSFVLEEVSPFDAPEVISSIKHSELEELLHTFFLRKRAVLSVVLPLEEKHRKEEQT